MYFWGDNTSKYCLIGGVLSKSWSVRTDFVTFEGRTKKSGHTPPHANPANRDLANHLQVIDARYKNTYSIGTLTTLLG